MIVSRFAMNASESEDSMKSIFLTLFAFSLLFIPTNSWAGEDEDPCHAVRVEYNRLAHSLDYVDENDRANEAELAFRQERSQAIDEVKLALTKCECRASYIGQYDRIKEPFEDQLGVAVHEDPMRLEVNIKSLPEKLLPYLHACNNESVSKLTRADFVVQVDRRGNVIQVSEMHLPTAETEVVACMVELFEKRQFTISTHDYSFSWTFVPMASECSEIDWRY